MPAVLITRPLADAARLEARLCAAGYAVLSEPLLTIEPTEDPMPSASDFDAVMMTSANAPARFVERDSACKTLLALPCFCVGEHTAAVARQAGFSDVRTSAGNGLDLAEAVRAALQPPQSVLHIAGADIASAGRDQLAAWGYAVIPWQVYRAIPATVLSPRLLQTMREGGIDAALFFSPRTAALFSELVERHEVASCCQSLTAIGLSEVVVGALRGLPWRLIVAAESPTEEDMIVSLQHSCLPVTSAC